MEAASKGSRYWPRKSRPISFVVGAGGRATPIHWVRTAVAERMTKSPTATMTPGANWVVSVFRSRS